MPDLLVDQRDNGVVVLTLNRPESLNAMGGELMPLFARELERCAHDPAVRCVVVTGAGRGFCAGGDVKGFAARGGYGAGEGSRPLGGAMIQGVADLAASEWRTSGLLHTMPKPTIAMVNGPAAGAGMSVALACDLRIASDRAKFTTAFRNVGFSGDFGGSYFLPRLVGMAKARELYFLADVLDAAAALALGVVNRVVPHEELERETLAIADRLAAGPTLAYGRMKENLNLAETSDLPTLLRQEALNMRLLGMTHDHREAAQAFVEKRPPVFQGS